MRAHARSTASAQAAAPDTWGSGHHLVNAVMGPCFCPWERYAPTTSSAGWRQLAMACGGAE